MDFFVARQPILGKDKGIYAYELLFRDGTANFMPDTDGDFASSKLLSGSFFTMGLEQITDGRKAFINFTRKLLTDRAPLICPKESTVIEILEDVTVDDELVEACREFKRKGYLIALDDFVYSQELDPLIALADIIKFDFRESTETEIRDYLKRIPEGTAQLLAEKVETQEEFDLAAEMGFTLFQGYFFCKPQIIKGKEVPASQLNILRVMAEINDPDCDLEKVNDVISRDVGLTYKLLRFANSAFFSRKNEITSIQDAAMYMGLDELRRFITVINLSKLGSDKPAELLKLSCQRAEFCKRLGEISEASPNVQELFTLGIFSLIDALLDQPMKRIMEELPLSDNITAALIREEGEIAGFLNLTIAYEKGRWDTVSRLSSELGLPEDTIPEHYIRACEWGKAITAAS